MANLITAGANSTTWGKTPGTVTNLIVPDILITQSRSNFGIVGNPTII